MAKGKSMKKEVKKMVTVDKKFDKFEKKMTGKIMKKGKC